MNLISENGFILNGWVAQFVNIVKMSIVLQIQY